MRQLICVACAFLIFTPAFAAQPSPDKSRVNIPNSESSFHRAAPLPKWVQPLAEIPATERTDPVVYRLSEVQSLVGDKPATLINRAIQVNEKNALDTIGQFSINYYPIYQSLSLHRVAILRAGQIIDRTATVSARLLQRESNMESGMYGGATTVHLLLDDVRIGDTLWITYSTEGENPVFGKRWADDFSWDNLSPIELRRLTVLHPKDRPIYWRQLGDFRHEEIKPQIDQVGALERIRFEGRGIEAIENEPSIPSEYIPARMLQFSEYADWHTVATWADSLFPKTGNSPALKALSQQFLKEPTSTARVSAALHWVQNEIRYFSVSVGENSHRPQAPDVVLQRRYGDCKDKSYLLVSLLGQLGIEAHPVLLASEAPRVPIKILPTPKWFDHAIVQVNLDGHQYYVDPTNNAQAEPLEKLPSAFPEAYGLVVSTSTQGLSQLPPSTDTQPQYEHVENIVISKFDGDVALETHEIYRGNYADWARAHFTSLSGNEFKKEMLSLYEKQYPGVTVLGAPDYIDRNEDNTVELTAKFNLPKPVLHEGKYYKIPYDSQILAGSLGIPDKVVRNFPFALAKGKYRGRYRLKVTWPNSLRAYDAPSSKEIDNPFFNLQEAYVFRGNLLDYQLDYEVKNRIVEAADLPALEVQAKRLNEYVSSDFQINESVLLSPESNAMPISDVDSVRLLNRIRTMMKKYGNLKASEIDPQIACDMVIGLQEVADVSGRSVSEITDKIEPYLRADFYTPGTRLCLARESFSKGDFQKSVDLYQAEKPLPDDSEYTLDLAWARFYVGDIAGALTDLERYRVARAASEADKRTDFDVTSEIELYLRAGKPVPADLQHYASAMPDGPWPRPLLAMEAGLVTPDALIKIAESYPKDARDLALNDAWYSIAQVALATHDSKTAQAALQWYNSNGIRSSGLILRAKAELNLMKPSEPFYQAGMSAYAQGDLPRALADFRESANKGVAAAQDMIAQFYYNGTGVTQDYSQVLHWVQLAADQGYPHAQNLLGVLYLDGKGVTQDETIAMEWYRKAAAQGDVNAQSNLGYLYLHGKSVKQDYVEAARYYLLAAKQGDINSEVTLAQIYFNGIAGKPNFDEAFIWAERASLTNDINAEALLGMMYFYGRGPAKNQDTALALFRHAASKDQVEAIYLLGIAYEHGEGVDRDEKQAAQWYEKSVTLGDLRGTLSLSQLYLNGRGVPHDPEKAFKMIAAAADKGYAPAQIKLSGMYETGTGTTKDIKRAEFYLRKAAEQGDVYAQETLGIKLHFGKGFEKNSAEAVEWYEKAIAQGSNLALNNLGDMYEKGDGVKQDYVQSMKLYRQAANNGYRFAFVSLGSVYSKGIGQPRNPMLAYTYFQIAGKEHEAVVAERREEVAKELSAEQLKRAQEIASNWKQGAPLPEID